MALLGCECGSKSRFKNCCEPYLKGESWPQTAEALMRSRYTAYTKKNYEFLKNSLHPKMRHDYDENNVRQWAENAIWKGLEVKTVDKGLKDDAEGSVEFVARFEMDEKPHEHHELARFKKSEGRWYFYDGRMLGAGTVRREEPKVGRNDPCPCGSGKKYKKCCLE